MKKGYIGSTVLLAVLMLSITPIYASASGFGVYSNNAEAVALGGAFIARASGANAIFYNPAALIIDSKVSVTTTIYSRKADVSIDSLTTDNKQLTNATGAVAVRINNWFAVGAGYFPMIEVRNSLAKLSDLPITSFNSSFDVKIFRTAAALKINDNLSIGAGYDIYGSELDFLSTFKLNTEFRYSFDIEPTFVQQRLQDFSESASGFTAGLLAHLSENFSVGVVYRSEVEMNLEGQTTYPSPWPGLSNVLWGDLNYGDPSPFPPYKNFDPKLPFEEQFTNSPHDASISFTLPSDIGLGLNFAVTDRLSASFDAHIIQWSSMNDSIISGTLLNASFAEDWQDTTNIHFGAEYKYNEYVSFQGGFAHIPSPIPQDSTSLFLPYGDQRDFTLGVSINTTAYKTGVKEALGGIGVFATLVFSQFDDFSTNSLETYAPSMPIPFADFPIPSGITHEVSDSLFSMLVGFSFTLN